MKPCFALRLAPPADMALLALLALLAAPAAAPAAPKDRAAPAVRPGDSPLDTALFAGGPFWALEAAFEGVPGVAAAVSGYTGGKEAPGSYARVLEGKTGHCLAVRVDFDPRKVGYARLLEVYLRNIDPTGLHRQFADTGAEFRAAIFPRDSLQRRAALAALERLRRSGRFRKEVVVAVEPAGAFHPAEAAQQDYHARYPGRYRTWLRVSGRERALRELWGEGGKAKAKAAARPAPGGKAGGPAPHSSASRRDSQ